MEGKGNERRTKDERILRLMEKMMDMMEYLVKPRVEDSLQHTGRERGRDSAALQGEDLALLNGDWMQSCVWVVGLNTKVSGTKIMAKTSNSSFEEKSGNRVTTGSKFRSIRDSN